MLEALACDVLIIAFRIPRPFTDFSCRRINVDPKDSTSIAKAML